MKMAADERNFRSSYYEKVGFRSVEEKKSLEILLKEKPLHIQKLKQFCLRFTVPLGHRPFLWKALLGVTPRYTDSIDFVWRQRTETHDELLRSLKIMHLVNSSTPKPTVILALWLLENGNLAYDISTQLDDPFFKGLIAISESLVEIVEGDVDTYWIARGFYRLVTGFQASIPRLVDATRYILEKEDQELYTHCNEIAAFDAIRVDRWCFCLFAGVLHKAALVKIWDKLIGGSVKILAFVAVVVITTLRRHLLSVQPGGAMPEELGKLSDETSELISNKAIELWQQYGSPSMVGDSKKDEVR